MTGELLRKKIESFLEEISLKSLLLSSKSMSEDYRLRGKRNFSENQEDVLAYLATRMPATHAALLRVFQELQQRLPHFVPRSLLDVGCGPATTLWASELFFPQLEHVYLVEKEESFLSMAKRIAEDLTLYSRCQWLHNDMVKDLPVIPCDLVIASYSLGEIAEEKRKSVVERLWAMVKDVFILIEPGTPKGFERLRAIRDYLLSLDAQLIAPCSHQQACPMTSGDWCHFYARLNRSSLHRKVKDADLNYEDEKFSYLIFSKIPANLCASRLLRHPRINKGHVQITLCTPAGVKEAIVTKKDKELYRKIKKTQWGDAL